MWSCPVPNQLAEIEEAHEEKPVDLELSLLVREDVERLQYLEHRHQVVGRASALGSIRARQSRHQRRAEQIGVNRCGQRVRESPRLGVGLFGHLGFRVCLQSRI